jgi:hypothetical protein
MECLADVGLVLNDEGWAILALALEDRTGRELSLVDLDHVAPVGRASLIRRGRDRAVGVLTQHPIFLLEGALYPLHAKNKLLHRLRRVQTPRRGLLEGEVGVLESALCTGGFESIFGIHTIFI